MRIISWDPGQNGAFVLCDTDHDSDPSAEFRIWNTSDFGADDMVWWLSSHMARCDLFIYEFQTGCAGIATSAPSMFKYGTHYGMVLGCVETSRRILKSSGRKLPKMLAVTPQDWQGKLGIPKEKKLKAGGSVSSKESKRFNASVKSRWKNKLKQRAIELFPGVKVTLANCDALLICDYAKNKYATPGA
jgi:hypothetical protein